MSAEKARELRIQYAGECGDGLTGWWILESEGIIATCAQESIALRILKALESLAAPKCDCYDGVILGPTWDVDPGDVKPCPRCEAGSCVEQLRKDAERLDKLQRMTRGYGNGWILRDSTTGRGMRLHETSQADAKPTVREAIDALEVPE